MFSTRFCLFKIQCVYSVHASMCHLGKTEKCLVLCCQISSNTHGRALVIFIFLAASVNGPGNCLVMDIVSMYNQFQELLHLTLEGKGQTDLGDDWAMLIALQGL